MDENARLKKLLAEAILDNGMLRDVAKKMVTPAARREAAAHLEQVHGVSQRRACEALGVDRSSVRYRSRRRMTVSFAPGYARSLPFAGASAIAGCMYCCGGKVIALNHKKLRRALRPGAAPGSQAWRPKRALGTLSFSQAPNQRWPLDFLHDQLSDGRRFRILAVVADFSRKCLALVADA